MVQSLGDSIQKAANAVVMEGVVSAENVGTVLTSMSSAVSLLSQAEVANPTALSSGLQVRHHRGFCSAVQASQYACACWYGAQCIGRLVNREDGHILEAAEAVDVVMDVVESHIENVSISETAVQCLGDLACNASAVTAMSSRKCIGMLVDSSRSTSTPVALKAAITDVRAVGCAQGLLCFLRCSAWHGVYSRSCHPADAEEDHAVCCCQLHVHRCARGRHPGTV